MSDLERQLLEAAIGSAAPTGGNSGISTEEFENLKAINRSMQVAQSEQDSIIKDLESRVRIFL